MESTKSACIFCMQNISFAPIAWLVAVAPMAPLVSDEVPPWVAPAGGADSGAVDQLVAAAVAEARVEEGLPDGGTERQPLQLEGVALSDDYVGQKLVVAPLQTLRAVLRSLVLPIYLPAAVQATAISLVIPVLPLFARALGAPDSAVGGIVGANGLGSLCAGMPAGLLAGAVGERAAMMLGSLIAAAAAIGSALTPNAGLLFASRFVGGVGLSCYQVARQSYLSAAAPKAMRGRAISLMGGVVRMANIVGPAAGGLVAELAGQRAAFWAQVIFFCSNALIVAAVLPRPSPRTATALQPAAAAAAAAAATAGAATTAGSVAATEAGRRCPTALLRRTALTVPVVFALSICRSTRGLLVPLKAADMHASHAVTGAIAAFSFVTDTAFFPAAGWLVDRKGRKWSGAPSLACMGVSYVLMSTSSSQLQLLLCAALTGAGNGLSSGLVQTLGADLKEGLSRREGARFLGVFKTLSDAGAFAGPLLAGSIAQLLGLDAACRAVGLIGLAGAAFYVFCGIETASSPKLAATSGVADPVQMEMPAAVMGSSRTGRSTV